VPGVRAARGPWSTQGPPPPRRGSPLIGAGQRSDRDVVRHAGDSKNNGRPNDAGLNVASGDRSGQTPTSAYGCHSGDGGQLRRRHLQPPNATTPCDRTVGHLMSDVVTLLGLVRARPGGHH
jgi:hypothetical protein